MSVAQPITKQSLEMIMKSRDAVSVNDVNEKVTLTIQGNGNIFDVKNKGGEYVQSVREPGSVFQKKIFNCKANSQLAMKDERNGQLLRDGHAAWAAGEFSKADEYYSKYLNNVQLSFGIPLPSAVADTLSNNMDIEARVQKITTENGSLLTIDPSTITVIKARKLSKTTFTVDEVMPAFAVSTETASVEA